VRKSGSYIGTNAFGAGKVINYSSRDDYGVRLAPDSPIKIVGTGNFTFSLDPTEARALKPFLRVALVGTLAEPRVRSSHSAHAPTFSEPYETDRSGLYIT